MRAFIAMPFSKSFDKYWETIQETCKNRGVETYRVDTDLSDERHIDIAIKRELEKSDFVIAILTGDINKNISNPNVVYEVGYAQGLGKETILLSEGLESLSFDFKQQRTCLYGQDAEKLKQSLSKEIESVSEKLYKKYRDAVINFTNEVERCLRIVLPFKYRMFSNDKGVCYNHIWYGVYYYKDKYFAKYGVAVGESFNEIELFCWLGRVDTSTDEQREKVRIFARKYEEQIRKNLGHDVIVNFEVGAILKNLKKEFEFVKETVKIQDARISTKEALSVALRLHTYIETFQPVFDSFLEKENLLKSMEPKYQ